MNELKTIKVSGVSKAFRLYNRRLDRIKETFHPFKKKYYEPFWALKDISFEVEKGEAIGIIGRNGSGKSTLLQILCGIIKPTAGNVKVEGRISALLELGAGFNPEFTGKENVYLNAAILGFSKKEMDERYDDIVRFAEIGEFIDNPVKTYSSGMYVRLAFAVHACMDPQILIVDEALSVGDFFFQQKCMKHMLSLRKKKVTLIFVSHDSSMVRDLCDKVVYLQNGQQRYFGPSRKAIQLYYQEGAVQLQPNECQIDENLDLISFPKNEQLHIVDILKKKAIWMAKEGDKTNNLEARLAAVIVLDSENEMTMKFRMGEKIKFKVLYQTFTENPIHVSVTVKNRYNQIINCNGSYISEIEPLKVKKGSYIIFEFQMECGIELGHYSFSFNLSKISLPNRGITIDETPWLGPLAIDWDFENKKAPFLGMFNIPFHDAKFIPVDEKCF